jgi:glutathione peroxidase
MNGIQYVRPGNGFQPLFPLTSKTEVNGANETALYAFLKASCPPTDNEIGDITRFYFNPVKATDVTWNFEKFLVDSSGVPRFRFHPSVDPVFISVFVEDLLREDGQYKK